MKNAAFLRGMVQKRRRGLTKKYYCRLPSL